MSSPPKLKPTKILNLDNKSSLKISNKEAKKFDLGDFSVISQLSRGAFGFVFLVNHREKGFLCLKRLDKKSIEKEKHLQLVLNERNILKTISKKENSFLIKCHETL